jgi:hypothetical protein
MLTVIDREFLCGDAREDFADAGRIERFSCRRRGEFPVRAHAARTRARMRSRASSSTRRKAAAFNGANRRGKGKYFQHLGPAWDFA